MSEWQPIETAPRDGTYILIWLDYDDPKHSHDIGWFETGWCDDGCFRYRGDDGPCDMQPRHWMPLPEPPR